MGGKISVGAPYFNLMFILLTAPLARAHRHRHADSMERATACERLKVEADGYPRWSAAIVAALLLSLTLPEWIWSAVGGACYGDLDCADRLHPGDLANACVTVRWLSALRSTPAGFYGMLLGHVGIAFFIVGVTLTSLYNVRRRIYAWRPAIPTR